MVTMLTVSNSMDFPSGADGKESAGNARDPGSIPGLGRCPGEGHGNPLQYACHELQSMGSQRVGHNWATTTCTHPTQQYISKY